MWTKRVVDSLWVAHLQACLWLVPRATNSKLSTPLAWHNRRDWPFTPFVVVVGSKYFLPAPVCLLFDWATVGSRRWLRPIPPRRVWGGFDAWPR